MAVAMEVAWRGAELGSPVLDMKTKQLGSPGGLDMTKKRAWGADAQKLVQLMMGQLHHSSSEAAKPAEVTLDLLGNAGPSTPGAQELDCNSTPEFLELDPDQPLPSGWEKCLDLKTGKLYFVNKSTGVSSDDDPRKQQRAAEQLPSTVAAAAAPSPLAHEFLGSKKSETLREESLKTSSSSSSGGSPRSSSKPAAQLLSFSTGKQLWNLQLDDRSVSLINKTTSGSPKFPKQEQMDEEESNLELNLNLAAGGASPSSHHHQQQHQEQSVCTMEMVQKALQRTEKAMGKREMMHPSKPSGSSSFSSLTSARSVPSWSHASPSTSSSSSTSSRSSLLPAAAPHDDLQATLKASTPGVCEAESKKAETTTSSAGALVMGACTRCLMYVMLNKSDPKCPRCESEVPLDFGAPPSKRQRVSHETSTGSDRRQ